MNSAMADVELPADPCEANTALQKSDIESQQVEKKPRKRLKKICSQIRQQMEFYFSDANLHKDGFVKQLIDKRDDRYVPISVFSDFNKIRELTTDMKLVAKALSTSAFLEVKEGGEYVRRKTPYTEPKDVDDRTIYVESLPRDVDHDWLRQTFAHFGKVVYISVPRYRTSGDIKGFAFIEFDTKEATEKACQAYQTLDPEDETTTRFPKFNKQLQTLQKQISLTGEKVDEKRLKRRSTTSESSTGENEAHTTKRQKRASESSDTGSTEGCSRVAGQEGGAHITDKGRGRKRSADSGAEDLGHGEGQTGAKKSSSGLDVSRNKENTDQSQDREKTEDAETQHLRKRKRSEESCDKEEGDEEKKVKREGGKKEQEKGEKGKKEEPQTPTEEPRGVMVDPVKRKRLSDVAEAETGEAREVKRVRISELVHVKENVEETHKKRRNKKKKKKELREKTEEVTPQIKVIPKQVWLELRKEYLELQRSSMQALKKSLKKIKKHQPKGVKEGAVPLESYVGASDKAAAPGDQTNVAAEKPSTGVEYTPGVIIKIDTDQPCMRKELKETLSLVASVPYVDFQDGDQQGHVRCATPEDALRVIASRPATFRVSLLQAEEEADYWMKINADRDQKRAAKTRSKKRGTQKLMDRAEKTTISGVPKKHIVFDD